MHTSKCTSTIETAVYENRTYGGVRGRRLVTASYSILWVSFLFHFIQGDPGRHSDVQGFKAFHFDEQRRIAHGQQFLADALSFIAEEYGERVRDR